MIDYQASNIINAALNLDLRSAAGLEKFRKVVHSALEEAAQQKHKERHEMLHKIFDELAADFINQTGKRLSNSTCLELLQWSFEQTKHPTKRVGNKG